MALLAMAIPIPANKAEHFKRFMSELKGPRFADFKASRKKVSLHERTFLQKTPTGDLVVVTLEGSDPAGSLARFGQGTDEFTKWFLKEVKEIHGLDLMKPSADVLPELAIDTGP